MKVLFIGYVWPEPRSSAAGRRSLDLISLLQAQGGEIHFACAAEPGQQRADLEALAITSVKIRLNCSSFDAQLLALQPDVVVFDRFVCEEQFGWRVEKSCPAALRILDTQDLHCLRESRRQALKQGRQWQAADLNMELAWREIAAIWRSDLSLIISPFEVELLQRYFGLPTELLFHLPLLAKPAAEVSLPSFDQRRHCVVVGNFRHAPNWDALQYLRSELWPAIRRRLPQVQCHVYGAYQPPKAEALHNEALGFLLRGWAADAQQVVAQARLCLAPLRFGAGQKGKLLEAMECATPSITTSVGAEGMQGDAPWPGAVADQPEAFIEAAVRLYQQQAEWQRASEAAAPLLASAFDRGRFEFTFKNKINDLTVDLKVHRQQFFSAQMIRHHRLRSHQYMSQWIELKTQLADDEQKDWL